MKPKKVSKVKVREFQKVAAKNRATAKRIAALRQKVILGFAAPSTREGVHSSLVIAPNNVVQLHKRRKPKMVAAGDAAHSTRPPGEGFRYQRGFMVPRFQKSSRYMEQVAKAKREHLTEVEQLVRDNRQVKRLNDEITKMLTLGDMARVEKLRDARAKVIKKIQRQYAKTMRAKQKVISVVNNGAGMSGLSGDVGMGDGALDDFMSSFTGAFSDIGVSLKDTLQAGVTGVIQAKTAAEIAKAEMEAKAKLMQLQLEMERKAAEERAKMTPVQTAVQTVTGTAQAAIQAPWYRNPLVLIPAAVGGYLLLKK